MPPRPSRPSRFLRSLGPLLRATAAGWVRDNAMRLSAALALYTILSLAPLLVVTAKVVGVVLRDQDYARAQITAQVAALAGPQVAAAVQPMLAAGGRPGGGLAATLFSTGVLLFSATGVFVELQDAMNTIWGVKPRPGRGVRDFVRTRLMSLAMVFGTGFLLLVSMCLTTAAVRVAAFVAGGRASLVLVLDPAASLLVVTVLFAGIFKFLPDVRLAWRHVWVGGTLTGVLFTAGKYALAAYFGRAAPTSAFGAAGSLAAVMLWVYYSSFILFFGAEFTKVWSVRHLHDRVEPEAGAVAVTEEDRARQGIPSAQRMGEALAGDPLTPGPAAGGVAGAAWSVCTSTLNRKPTASSLMASIMAPNMSKPSRWYSTSGSRWANARRLMPSRR
ncbi:MAG: Ribonuclease [Phycisphaerales bacterium]|nr:Ribonuclease [Phycisphaerales bacterium]